MGITGLRPSRSGIDALLLAAGLSAAIPAWTRQPPVIPPQSSILTTLMPGHPRLLIPSGGFAAVKAGIEGNADATALAASIESSARKLLTAAPSKYEIPDGLRLLTTCRQVKDRIYLLAMAYHLTGDTALAGRAWREMEAAAGFPDWNPKHFLDVGEMTHAFAIGYDWLYAYLSAQQRTVVRTALVDKGLKAADASYKAKAWWTSSPYNWNQVCNGGIAMGALAIAEEDREFAAAVLHQALTSVVTARSLEEFGPDGGWAEGPGYWSYAIEYTTVMLAGLESALGTTFGIQDIPGLSEAGYFPIHTTGPMGRSFNYADAGGESPARDAGQYWLARTYRQPLFAWARRRLGTGFGVKDLLWHSAAVDGPKAAKIPLDRHFRHLDLVTCRSAWEDSTALFAGFKAGSNQVGHSHLDLGTFLIDALGVRWAGELGSDNYNLPGYFTTADMRWTYYRLRAEGQNTLVLNPGKGPDQDPRAAAPITLFTTFPDEVSAQADLTPAYASRARRVQRGFALIKDRSRFLVQDEITADSAVDTWWFMHSRTAMEVAGDGATALLSEGDKRLHARILSPIGARFEVMDARPLPSSPNDTAQNRNAGWRKLAIHLTGAKDIRLAVVLTPLAAGAAIPSDFPAVLPLGPAWPTGKVNSVPPWRDAPGTDGAGTGRAARGREGLRAWGNLLYTLDGRRAGEPPSGPVKK